eukprot:368359_1
MQHLASNMSSFTIKLTNKDRNLLQNKIFSNILQHRDNERYKKLGIAKISKKFDDPLCMQVLYDAGFTESECGTKLIFNDDKLTDLEATQAQFKRMSSDNLYHSKYSQNISSLYQSFDAASAPIEHVIVSCNNVDDCPISHRLTNVMLLYKLYINGELGDCADIDLFETVYGSISETYNNTNVLNDFNHFIQSHTHQLQPMRRRLIKTIYDEGTCDVSKCVMTRRNQRDRESICTTSNILYQLYPNNNDIASEQILDRIHCYFLHTTARRPNKPRVLIQDTDTKKDNVPSAEHKQCDEDQPALMRSQGKYNRFDSAYQYGITFYYWPYYKNNYLTNDDSDGNVGKFWTQQNHTNANSTFADWYIACKYSDLKNELLNNQICKLDPLQWIQLERKAQNHRNTDHVRNIYCRNDNALRYYGMMYRVQITIDHLIALMTYCNFDVVQFEFSKTCRRKHEKESDEEVKERHRNYYWMGRLLRECIECFGMREPTTSMLRVYHGTKKHFTFSSLHGYIKGPFSTSLSCSVATHIFCDNTGMVLELNLDCIEWGFVYRLVAPAVNYLSCFDMQWISDFPDEQEIFCFGGRCRFEFRTIIDPQMGDYIRYVEGMRRMLNGMTTGRMKIDNPNTMKLDSDKNSAREKCMASQLLAHEFSRYYPNDCRSCAYDACPPYFKEILHINCQSIKFITFFEAETSLHDKYFKTDSGWLDLKAITDVFPNVENIQYYLSNKDMEWWEESEAIDYTMWFLMENKDIRLKRIHIQIKEQLQKQMTQYISTHHAEPFWDIHWSIMVSSEKETEQWMKTEKEKLDYQLNTNSAASTEFCRLYDATYDKSRRLGVTMAHIPKQINPTRVTIHIESLAAIPSPLKPIMNLISTKETAYRPKKHS